MCRKDAGRATEAANLVTYTKEMLEDHQHQMNWERGQIDYLGVDSFDNILRKIETVICQKEPDIVTPEESRGLVIETAVEPLPPRAVAPPAPVPGQTEREEMFVHRSPRKREAVTNVQLEESKLSPSKKGMAAFRPRPKPMRGRGQADHRERFVRAPRRRNQQPVSHADLEAVLSAPFIPTDS